MKKRIPKKRCLILGCIFIIGGGVWPVQAEPRTALPAMVVRAEQQLRWGTHDPKLRIPYDKKTFSGELMNLKLFGDEAVPSVQRNQMRELLWKEYDLFDQNAMGWDIPLKDDAQDTRKTSFWDFNLWLGYN